MKRGILITWWRSPVARHVLLGALLGYLVLHPISMAIFFFQQHNHTKTLSHATGELVKQIGHAFSIEMLPMALMFTVIGAVIGMLYGLYTRTVLHANELLAEREKALKSQILVIEKQASLGIMASSIGHEINNLLSGIVGYSKLLEMDTSMAERFRADLDIIFKSSNDLEKLARALTTLAKPRPTSTSRVDLRKLMDDQVRLLRICGILKEVEIIRRYEEQPVEVACDPFLLEQAVRNIAINAAHAMNGRGRLVLEVGGVDADGRKARVLIRDNGPGIAEQNLDKLFEPFFTTKTESQGTGLGLSIVRQIVEQFGGGVTARNSKEGGAEFEIILPGAGSIA